MRTCSIEGCEGKHQALGYCNKHYIRYRRGKQLPVEPVRWIEEHRNDARCIVDGCERQSNTRKMCLLHYKRYMKGQDLTKAPRMRQRNPPRKCTIDGCDRKHQGLGYCHMHYMRYRQGRDMNMPLEVHKPVGNTIEDVQDLLDMGLKPWEISEQLGRSLDAIVALCRRYGNVETARIFDRVANRMRRGTALEAEEVLW